uniref:DUF4218 domain-containing protein n=1 Tax=Tanacetum cinerariifolium TaxID=118510 RepID=A0A6L2MID2_TANCI|nr:hypothetical protein [Tanacetum cinerariifolium]
MRACLNDLNYIPPNNEQNEPTQGDISETSNKPSQAIRSKFEELYVSANEDLYPGCDYVTRLDLCQSLPILRLKSSFMLTLLIPGPKSPGKDIDVYLRPLIDDLKDLWAKPWVKTIDVATGQKFNMRVMVLWTINDFSARSKTTYVGHRRFLKKLHKWKRSLDFIGEIKNGDPPRKFDRDEIMAQHARLPTRVKGKHLMYGDLSTSRRQRPSVSARNELFALACGPTRTPISVNSCIVNGVRFVVHSRDERRTTQNSGICSPGEDGEMYYVKQCFYLEDMARRPLGWKVVEHVYHKKFSNGGVIVVEDDPDIIHVDNSPDLALTTTLNDLEILALHINGQSVDVDAPTDMIDVDENDDIIDDKDVFPRDLADFDDEDLVNVDDDDMSADVAKGHRGDSGSDDHPPSHESARGYRGCGECIPLESVDIFWRTLDVSWLKPFENEDIQCEDELHIFNENFNKQSKAGKRSFLRKLGSSDCRGLDQSGKLVVHPRTFPP